MTLVSILGESEHHNIVVGIKGIALLYTLERSLPVDHLTLELPYWFQPQIDAITASHTLPESFPYHRGAIGFALKKGIDIYAIDSDEFKQRRKVRSLKNKLEAFYDMHKAGTLLQDRVPKVHALMDQWEASASRYDHRREIHMLRLLTSIIQTKRPTHLVHIGGAKHNAPLQKYLRSQGVKVETYTI